MALISDVVPGSVFGRLTVVELFRKPSKRSGHQDIFASCECQCGNKVAVRTYTLGENTRSCGCLHIDTVTKTGLSKRDKKLYYAWRNLIGRCTSPNNRAYKNYGAKGVTVCPEWLNSADAFESWAKANGYAEGMSIDRIDPAGNYEPSNCRWASMTEQRGNKRNRQMYLAWGELKSVSDWLKDARCTFKNRRIIRQRVYVLKWPVERAMTEPVANDGSFAFENKRIFDGKVV